MEIAELNFLGSLRDLSTAKDKVFEVSNVMLSNQQNFSNLLSSLWLKEFQSLKEEKKRLAMLYIMNDVLLKSTKEAKGEEYLKEFSLIFPDIITNLAAFKNDFLLEEFRKIVMIWEKPGNLIYVPAYTTQLKVKIQEAIDLIQDDRFGSSVINEFEVTRKLRDLEMKHFENLELAKEIDLHFDPKFRNFSKNIEKVIDKCEKELIDRSLLLLELSKLLEQEFEKFNNACQTNI